MVDRSTDPKESSGRERITAELRERIVNGEYRAGEMLSERIIEEDLKAGRAAVRQALVCLQSEGLIEILPHHGTRVRRLGVSEAQEIVAARLLIEQHVARLLHDRPHVALKDAIQINDQMRKLATTKEVTRKHVLRFAELDLEFHCELCGLAGFRCTFAPFMRNLGYRFRLFAAPSARSFQGETVKEHTAILRAIRSRSKTGPRGTDAAVRRHLQNAFQRWEHFDTGESLSQRFRDDFLDNVIK